MKRSRFTEEQIAFALKLWELGTSVAADLQFIDLNHTAQDLLGIVSHWWLPPLVVVQ